MTLSAQIYIKNEPNKEIIRLKYANMQKSLYISLVYLLLFLAKRNLWWNFSCFLCV